MSGDVLLALAMVLSQSPNPGPTFLPASPPTPQAAAPAKIPVLPAERLTSFETDHAFADWSFQGWKVSADAATLKDFGRNESDARTGLRLIRELHLNQRGVIGGPAPSLEYWLADGKAPQGSASGLRVLPIDAASLRVEQAQDQWVLRDDRRGAVHLWPESGGRPAGAGRRPEVRLHAGRHGRLGGAGDDGILRPDGLDGRPGAASPGADSGRRRSILARREGPGQGVRPRRLRDAGGAAAARGAVGREWRIGAIRTL